MRWDLLKIVEIDNTGLRILNLVNKAVAVFGETDPILKEVVQVNAIRQPHVLQRTRERVSRRCSGPHGDMFWEIATASSAFSNYHPDQSAAIY